jgi:hypothetical protein
LNRQIYNYRKSAEYFSYWGCSYCCLLLWLYWHFVMAAEDFIPFEYHNTVRPRTVFGFFSEACTTLRHSQETRVRNKATDRKIIWHCGTVS